MGKKGQSILVFCLILAVLLVVLIGSIFIALDNRNQQAVNLKKRILGHHATIQISYILQGAYTAGLKDSTCTDPSLGSVSLFVLTSPPPMRLLCMPPGDICVNNQFRYCIAKDPGYLISEISAPEADETSQTKNQFSFSIDFSILPKANAQSQVWLPSLGGAPTAQVQLAGFSADKYIKCEPAVNWNSKCFKVRICTNGRSACPNRDDFFETVIAIEVKKS